MSDAEVRGILDPKKKNRKYFRNATDVAKKIDFVSTVPQFLS
jgi:chaperonin GroEL (HSP60 family)